MKIISKLLGAAGLVLATAACGNNADDKAAENIEAMTENRADQLEAQADASGNEAVSDALEDRADNVEEMGEDAAEKADDSDDARVENQVANAM